MNVDPDAATVEQVFVLVWRLASGELTPHKTGEDGNAMFPQYAQGAMVRLVGEGLDSCDWMHAGQVGKVEHVWFDHYARQWGYQVRVSGDLVATYEDGLEAVADDLSA